MTALSTAATLAIQLQIQTREDFEHWINRYNPSLCARLERLSTSSDQNRLDLINLGHITAQVNGRLQVSLYRATPGEGEIRPGDWVTLNRGHAETQLRSGSHQIASLNLVDLDDVFWAGTNANEFFYLPKAWRLDGLSPYELLKCLGTDALRILCEGEMRRISQHSQEIQKLQAHIDRHVFDAAACGFYHGPDHWLRVARLGTAVARSMGLDPLVPYVFGLVHDSHREDEGYDLMHGPRAAQFVRTQTELFSFLTAPEIENLAHACGLHSEGHTQGDPLVQACWDGDRLDLWRADIEPLPTLLCTPYARRATTIAAAYTNVTNGRRSHRKYATERE